VTAIPPLAFTYDGEALIPRAPKLADKHYVIGEVYTLAPYEQRSTATHNHEFAWLAEAWRNLPEDIADLYPSPEHLRKRGLIEAGYYDETAVDAGSNAAALRVAAAFSAREEFAFVIVRGPFVLIRTAKSQSRRAMDRATFQASKSKLMEIVAGMIGVSPETLSREAGRAA
jgi:hypothetical protein